MKKYLLFVLCAASLEAAEISTVPGPDDQGGMLMPMVMLEATSGSPTNPTGGALMVNFNPMAVPLLRPLEQWSPGDWFAESAAWRADLGSASGVGGTPVLSAGDGDLFNNQYGFMFMSMGSMMMANIPAGKSLAIKLTSVSSPVLESYNYSGPANRWDEVFGSVGSQVLWSGSMWHNYFTLPADAAPGTYSATFEIFIANTPFTGGTGFAQYDAAADAAVADPAFTSASVNYTWTVIPEPAVVGLLLAAGVAMAGRRSMRVRRSAC